MCTLRGLNYELTPKSAQKLHFCIKNKLTCIMQELNIEECLSYDYGQVENETN